MFSTFSHALLFALSPHELEFTAKIAASKWRTFLRRSAATKWCTDMVAVILAVNSTCHIACPGADRAQRARHNLPGVWMPPVERWGRDYIEPPAQYKDNVFFLSLHAREQDYLRLYDTVHPIGDLAHEAGLEMCLSLLSM